MGQRVDKGWIKTVGPDEDSTGNEEWFYIQDSGYPVCASPEPERSRPLTGSGIFLIPMAMLRAASRR